MAQGTLGLGRSGCPLLGEAKSLLAHVGSWESGRRTDRSWHSRLVGEEVSWDPLQGQVLWGGVGEKLGPGPLLAVVEEIDTGPVWSAGRVLGSWFSSPA